MIAIEALPRRRHARGATPFYSVPVPLGQTWVEVHLDRTQHTSAPVAVAWALELFCPDPKDSRHKHLLTYHEPDAQGEQWVPWGGAGTVVGEDLLAGQEAATSHFRVHLPDPANPHRRLRGVLTGAGAVTTSIELRFDDVPEPEFSPSGEHHSVAFDNVKTVTGGAVSSLTTASFTVSSSANAAGALSLTIRNTGTAAAAFGGSLGGVTASLVTGTDSLLTTAAMRSQIWQVVAPPSGSQTATMSWTNNADQASLAAFTATGVHQTTPCTNGTATHGSDDPSLSVTSASGDLAFDATGTTEIIGMTVGAGQTQKYNAALGSTLRVGGSIGDGTGTHTFTWTQDANEDFVQSGANFKQSASLSLTPAAGALAGTGVAPSLSRGTPVMPTAAALTVAGVAASLSRGTPFMPGAGALAIGADALTLLVSAILIPGTGTLAALGAAPALARGLPLVPAAGALLGAGAAPLLLRGTLLAPAAALLAIKADAGHLDFAMRPSPAFLAALGHAPLISVVPPAQTRALWEPIWLVEVGRQ